MCKSSHVSMTREASAFLAAVKWDEEAFEPRNFIRIHTLPQVAKSIKCRSSKKHHEAECAIPLNQPILWLNVTRFTRIIAQPVKFRNSLPSVPCGSKISLDHNFAGWFEILSEDGCTSRCMDSVAEVAKRKPEKFLIRQKVKCILASNPETSVLLQIGEILTFVSTERIPGTNHSFLRCITQSGNYENNEKGVKITFSRSFFLFLLSSLSKSRLCSLTAIGNERKVFSGCWCRKHFRSSFPA